MFLFLCFVIVVIVLIRSSLNNTSSDDTSKFISLERIKENEKSSFYDGCQCIKSLIALGKVFRYRSNVGIGYAFVRSSSNEYLTTFSINCIIIGSRKINLTPEELIEWISDEIPRRERHEASTSWSHIPDEQLPTVCAQLREFDMKYDEDGDIKLEKQLNFFIKSNDNRGVKDSIIDSYAEAFAEVIHDKVPECRIEDVKYGGITIDLEPAINNQ